MIVLIIYLSLYGFSNLFLSTWDLVYICSKDEKDKSIAYNFNEHFGNVNRTIETTNMNKIASVVLNILFPFFYFDAILVYLYNAFQLSKNNKR